DAFGQGPQHGQDLRSQLRLAAGVVAKLLAQPHQAASATSPLSASISARSSEFSRSSSFPVADRITQPLHQLRTHVRKLLLVAADIEIRGSPAIREPMIRADKIDRIGDGVARMKDPLDEFTIPGLLFVAHTKFWWSRVRDNRL